MPFQGVTLWGHPVTHPSAPGLFREFLEFEGGDSKRLSFGLKFSGFGGSVFNKKAFVNQKVLRR